MRLGTVTPVNFKVGTADVTRIYLGSDEVWTAVTPEVVQVGVGESNLSASNRTSHSYTYNFVSETQDGTVALLIWFLGDDGDEVRTPDAAVTGVIESTHSDPGGIHLAYYVPTQTDLNNGSRQFTYTTAGSEVYQFVIIELTGADTSDLIEDTFYDGSNVNRPSAGGTALDAALNGSYLSVAACLRFEHPNPPGMSPDQGFTSVADATGGSGALAAYRVAAKANVAAGSHTTPTFTLETDADINVIGVAINPAT